MSNVLVSRSPSRNYLITSLISPVYLYTGINFVFFYDNFVIVKRYGLTTDLEISKTFLEVTTFELQGR